VPDRATDKIRMPQEAPENELQCGRRIGRITISGLLLAVEPRCKWRAIVRHPLSVACEGNRTPVT
jgi:hypothetical protein